MITSLRARIVASWARLRARLITDVRQWWRLWSVQISLAGAALMAGWTALPADVRAQLPYANHIAAAMFILNVVARLTSQEGKA